MAQKGFTFIEVLVVLVVLIITTAGGVATLSVALPRLSGVVVWKKGVAPTPTPTLTVTPTPKSGLSRTGVLVYKADKDMCGEIVFVEKLGENFNSVLKEITTQKKEEFSKSCPDNPCQEVVIETTKAQEVRDLNNNLMDVALYFIIVKDKNTNLKVHAVSEAIDADGNLYNLGWCPD